MESIELLKALVALMSAVAGIAVYKVNHAKMLKTRADLVEQFQKALSEGEKYSVMEMFRLLHGLRMKYEDIQTLCADSNASHIIFALQKTPGMVKYRDSSLQYSAIFQKSWFRKLNKYFSIATAWLSGLVTLGLVFAFIFVQQQAALAVLLILIPSFAFLTYLLKDIKYDALVDSLVVEER